MPFLPLKIPPGVYRNGTNYQAKGRWNDANLVRWFEGTMRPVGGWRERRGGSPRAAFQVTGAPRGSIAWRDNSGRRQMAIGTHEKLYVMRAGGADLFDITPQTAGVDDLATGRIDSTAGIGYGNGAYGYDAYGTARQDTGIILDATTWSMDNFGEYLLAVNTDDGRLLVWDNDSANRAEEVTASAGTLPTSNRGVLVTEQRIVFCLAANGNDRLVKWSDQEDYTNWNPAATTQAGDFEIQTVGRIQSAVKIRGQVLILTTVDAHVANYIGPPFVYGFEKAGSNCGLISPQGVITADNFAAWMSDDGFYLYDGYVKPLPCEVSDYVFGDFNMSQKAKVLGVHNSDFFEIWWFYPSSSSLENDRYVAYNYRENHWTIGQLDRTTGVDKDVFEYPILVSSDGYIYDHEVGFEVDSATVYAESGPVEIGEGDNIVVAKEFIPDEKTQGNAQVTFKTKFYPNATESTHGPYSLANPTSVRFSGRQFELRVEGVNYTDWRWGVPRLDMVPGGRR